MMTRAEIESKVRAEVEKQVKEQAKAEERKAAAKRQEEKLHAALAKVEAKHAPILAALKAKATVVAWEVLSWDCEGRYSHHLATFATREEAVKAAKYTGPMGTASEPREMLVWQSAADFDAYCKAQSKQSEEWADVRDSFRNWGGY